MFKLLTALAVCLVLAGCFPKLGNEKHLQEPSVYEPAARDLAMLAQSASVVAPLLLHPEFGYTWLPHSLNSLDPQATSGFSVSLDEATLNLGGGFHRWGYQLERDIAASSPTTNIWHLTLFSEDSPDKPLFNFSTNPTLTLSKPALVASAILEYNRVIAAKPTIRSHQEKIKFLLFFDSPSLARAACADAYAALPDNWWTNLTSALVLVSTGHPTEADRQIQTWADAKPSYSHYLVLAFYAKLRSQPAAAAAAVEKAIACPIVELPDDETQCAYRGNAIGEYLCQTGQYSTVLKLVTALESTNGNWKNNDFSPLRTAAEYALSNHTTVIFKPSANPGFDPYKDFDLTKLLGP